MHKKNKQQHGAAFLEVLIAVIIISMGFLATSRMQIMGMRYNQSAFYKSQASIMAADIADRMRANLTGVSNGLYDDISTSSIPSDPGCISTGCNAGQLADLDVMQWGNNLNSILPQGEGHVTRNGTMFEIKVEWDEKISEAVETQAVSIWLNP